MFFAKTPAFLHFLMPGYTWRVPTEEKILFLTFDDGPIPELTPWVLETLNAYAAKATFFCVGENVQKHAAVFQQVLDEGHTVGNHTFNHLNGWETDTATYLQNVAQCTQAFQSRLFRPPYGRLKSAQQSALKNDFNIIMWDVLSGDFSQKITPEKCLQNVLTNARPGSIIVLHDSLKAARNMRFVLPRILDHFTARGYRFEGLSPKHLPDFGVNIPC
jgi:peptidoglycan/xylan/chitin deacetylase (PgdA/CDA1 family)